jgi:SAM-dependent methyltransferase
MKDYWELKFRNDKTLWGFEPSESAIHALGIFKNNHIKNILIPGIGYGRNAKLFLDAGITVTGIEISESAINIAKSNRLDLLIHNGSVTSMPFDNTLYDAVFCYALIHLLNKSERQQFLKICYSQLKNNGLMIFTVTSKMIDTYGRGRFLSKDRFEIESGLKVFFYDHESIHKEFSQFGLIQYEEIAEPVKFINGFSLMVLIRLICTLLYVKRQLPDANF